MAGYRFHPDSNDDERLELPGAHVVTCKACTGQWVCLCAPGATTAGDCLFAKGMDDECQLAYLDALPEDAMGEAPAGVVVHFTAQGPTGDVYRVGYLDGGFVSRETLAHGDQVAGSGA